MTVKEFYDQTGGDYESVIRRFKEDGRVARFVEMFLKDPSYMELKAGMEKNSAKEAFLAVHTLKGVCLNIGFSRLYESASDVTEALRAGNLELAREKMPRLDLDYGEIIAAAAKTDGVTG